MNIQSIALLFACIGCTVGATAFAQDDRLPDDDPQVTLDAPPLPRHADRAIDDPASNRPKPARPDRGEPSESATGRRRLPIPGQPARDLPEIGEPVTDESALPSLLDFIPHYGPKGALAAEVIYTGETFSLARGGINSRRTSNYRGNLDMVLTLDLEVAAGLRGGRLFVYGQNIHGKTLSQSDVGDVQLFSNLDSTISATDRQQFTTVAEYWYEQYLADDSIRLKLGKQDANADFAYSDLGGDFVHSSFGLPPTIPLPTFPSQALGTAGFWSVTEQIVIGGGIYDGTLPSGPQGVRWGFDTMGHNGAIFLGQTEWKGQLGPNGQLPSTIRAGAWYHNGSDLFTDFSPAANFKQNNSGGWLIADQMIFKEQYGTDDIQGLGAFVMYSGTRGDRNLFDSSLAGGFVYRGLLPRRDDDLIGLGFALAHFSDDYRAAELRNAIEVDSREVATELFYKLPLTPATTLQPEIQYISSPGGRYRDAMLYGLRFEAVL